jgi:transcriptional regulator with PAS, ATPase and Fis domain
MARNAVIQRRELVALRAALEEVCGASIVLDNALHVALASLSADALLGIDVPLGVSAPKLLCGESTRRPLAEALAEGRPVQATIARPMRGGGERLVRVRSIPLVVGRSREGWLLFFEEAAGAAADGAVEFHGIWTQNASMKQVFHVLERVGASAAPVLVRGETGTGKELVAHAVHALSPRRNGPFRAINCAALPPNLLESELFGHARGAFTGAVRDTPGHIQLAHEGTLFLDEIAEMPLDVQSKLLRVIETRTVLPVGGRLPVPADVRVVSATHRSLRKEVERGRFRADLMFRLRVIPVFLPPLRARSGDVMLLVRHFVQERNARGPRRVERIPPATERILTEYDWPGNVRELKNVVEYAFVIGQGPVLAPTDLPPELIDPAFSADVSDEFHAREPAGLATPTSEAARIKRALELNAGSRDRAAQVLGISRVTLWRRMKALGIGGDGAGGV